MQSMFFKKRDSIIFTLLNCHEHLVDISYNNALFIKAYKDLFPDSLFIYLTRHPFAFIIAAQLAKFQILHLSVGWIGLQHPHLNDSFS